MIAWLTTAFLTGLISSLHCVSMCGPLAAALPVGRLPRNQQWQAVGLYHAGRIITYSTLGALAGTMSLGLHVLGWQRPLALFSGGILLLSFIGRQRLPARLRWSWLDGQLTRTFRIHLQQPRRRNFAVLGVLNGLLPCGFTYLALAVTLVTNTPVAGASYMLLFGLGTLPALLGISLALSWLSLLGRQRLNRVLSLTTIVVAVLLISRGLANYQLPVQTADVIPICHGFISGQ